MNNKTKIIIDELKNAGLITKESDLTGGDSTNIIFDFMMHNYKCLLEPTVDEEELKRSMNKGKIFHDVIMKFGKYFLKNPQVILDADKILQEDKTLFDEEYRNSKLTSEPVIYVANHGFKDDILSTMLAINKRSFLVFGSLPQFYGTFDGYMLAQNGIILVNRKVKASRASGVPKAQILLKNGMSVALCPEGVWNKSPNVSILDLWSGFYRMAKKEDGTFYPVVPVINYIQNTHKPGKDNKIYTVVGKPIDVSGLTEEEAIERVRTIMNTWYWKLIEEYGKSTREELLAGFNDSTEAWEDELVKRVKTADKYDLEIEVSADKVKHDDPIKVWESIADLEITKENALEVTRARKLVKELKRNDFQHRY